MDQHMIEFSTFNLWPQSNLESANVQKLFLVHEYVMTSMKWTDCVSLCTRQMLAIGDILVTWKHLDPKYIQMRSFILCPYTSNNNEQQNWPDTGH